MYLIEGRAFWIAYALWCLVGFQVHGAEGLAGVWVLYPFVTIIGCAWLEELLEASS